MLRFGSSFGLSLVLAVLLLWPLRPSSALTIDEFNGTQAASASGSGTVGLSVLEIGDAIGGTRSMRAEKISGSEFAELRLVCGLGIVSHSQDATVTGTSLVTWDGDLDPSSLDGSGLGGIDLTQDGGTAISVEVRSFDFPFNQPVEITFGIHDASDPSGDTYSAAKLILNSQINGPVQFNIPFTDFIIPGPNGLADFTNVGAITQFINGANPDIDLTLNWLGTNGQCPQVPDDQGRVIDVCGECGGDGTSCLDCEGVPNGGKEYDICGICGGDGTECLDCEGEPFGDKEIDQCGICGGDGSECLDCAGVPYGGNVIDECGVCGGDGSACNNCEDIDMEETIANLDGGAKLQENLIKRILSKLGRIGRDKRTKNYIERTKAEAHELQISNWVLSWTLPVIATVCEGVHFCAVSSNEDKLTVYREQSLQLRKLAIKSVKKMRRKRGKKVGADKRFLKNARTLHNDNMTLADTVPLFQYTCTN